MVFQSCCSKLLCKVTPKSCSPKRFPAAASQNCSQNITAKRLPQSGYASNLFPKQLPKGILQSGSQKLLRKVITESCPPKFPKAAVFQSKVTVRQCCCKAAKLLPQLFPKNGLQSCYRKPRPKKALQTSAYRLRKQAQSVR